MASKLDDHGGVHDHGRGTGSLWLARPSPSRRVHRVGRRQFLTEIGRGTFAIAVLGVVASCSGDADDGDGTEGADDGDGAFGQDDGEARSTANDDQGVATTSTRWAQARLGSVSAYVLVRGVAAAVVDTGNPGSADQIGEALATLGATFDDVRHVVLTHAHPDHVGSLPVVLERAPGAAAYAGSADLSNIDSPIDVNPVGNGDDVFGLRVIETPGHTPGSISVYDPGIELLLAGDALNGNDDGTGLLGPNERFTADMATANTSVLELARLAPQAIGMGHGQPVTDGASTLLDALAAEL